MHVLQNDLAHCVKYGMTDSVHGLIHSNEAALLVVS